MGVAIVSQRMIADLLRRPDFFDRLPEFASVRPVQERLVKAGPGCRSCGKRVLQHDMFGEFLKTLMQLSPAGLARFKAYAGVDSIQCQWFNRVSGRYEIRVI
jgi:hypothetical protein